MFCFSLIDFFLLVFKSIKFLWTWLKFYDIFDFAIQYETKLVHCGGADRFIMAHSTKSVTGYAPIINELILCDLLLFHGSP